MGKVRKDIGKWWRRLFLSGAMSTGLVFGMIAWADHVAEEAGEGRLFETVEEVPETPVALVFGCNRLVNGRPNLYFKYRIEAAANLLGTNPKYLGKKEELPL